MKLILFAYLFFGWNSQSFGGICSDFFRTKSEGQVLNEQEVHVARSTLRISDQVYEVIRNSSFYRRELRDLITYYNFLESVDDREWKEVFSKLDSPFYSTSYINSNAWNLLVMAVKTGLFPKAMRIAKARERLFDDVFESEDIPRFVKTTFLSVLTSFETPSARMLKASNGRVHVISKKVTARLNFEEKVKLGKDIINSGAVVFMSEGRRIEMNLSRIRKTQFFDHIIRDLILLIENNFGGKIVLSDEILAAALAIKESGKLANLDVLKKFVLTKIRKMRFSKKASPALIKFTIQLIIDEFYSLDNLTRLETFEKMRGQFYFDFFERLERLVSRSPAQVAQPDLTAHLNNQIKMRESLETLKDVDKNTKRKQKIRSRTPSYLEETKDHEPFEIEVTEKVSDKTIIGKVAQLNYMKSFALNEMVALEIEKTFKNVSGVRRAECVSRLQRTLEAFAIGNMPADLIRKSRHIGVFELKTSFSLRLAFVRSEEGLVILAVDHVKDGASGGKQTRFFQLAKQRFKDHSNSK